MGTDVKMTIHCASCDKELTDFATWWCWTCDGDVPEKLTHPQRRIMRLEDQVADLKHIITTIAAANPATVTDLQAEVAQAKRDLQGTRAEMDELKALFETLRHDQMLCSPSPFEAPGPTCDVTFTTD